MTVNANSDVTSANTNSAYVSKTADDEKTGTLALNDGGSTAITDTQDFINQVADSNGETEGDANRKIYSSTEYISDGDDRKVAIGKLDAQAKVNADAIASTELLHYQGLWDASTNTPTLADGPGTQNDWYRVSVGGSVDLGSGSITYKAGDRIVHNGTIWERWESISDVTSFHGRTGDVVAVSGDYDTSEVTENTNLYYTNARVTANTNVTANTAKVTNATHTGDVTGATALTIDKTAITGKSAVTPVSGDYVLGTDASDSDNLKKFNVSDLLGGGAAATWQTYTPSWGAGFGTVTGSAGTYLDLGHSLVVFASCTAGTVSAAAATVSLPATYGIDSGGLTINNISTASGNVVGDWEQNEILANTNGNMIAAPSTSTTLVYFGPTLRNNHNHILPAVATLITGSGALMVVRFTVPIT